VLVHVVGREQHRAPLRREVADDVQASRRALGSKPVVRLVEEQQLRVADEPEAEVEPSLLAARELPSAGVLLLLQADEVDHLERVAGMG